MHLGDFGRDFQSGFSHLVFLLEVLLHVLHIVQEVLDAVVRHEGHCGGFAGDGVTQVAALEVIELKVEPVGALPQDAGQQLVGVGQVLVDVVAAVAAFQAAHGDAVGGAVLRSGLQFVPHLHDGVHTTGAADEDLAFVLAVEVEKDTAGEVFRVEFHGASEARLFVDGEDALDRTVFHFRVGDNGQGSSHADAVVSAEGRAVGMQPLALDDGLDGVFLEVVLLVAVLLAYHIHMGLQDDGLAVFHALGGGHSHDDVATVFLDVADLMVFGPFLEVSHHLGFLLRRTRHTEDAVELFPNAFRLEFQDVITHSLLI